MLQLVTAELLVRQGQPSQMRYRCKHALIQEAAYASLLRRRRQQLHTRIAEVLEARQATSAVTPPEVLARHYTAADLPTRAVPYWLQAGERCMQRSASPEAIAHLTRGLEELYRLPDTPARAHQELRLQTALGPALLITRGVAAPEVTQTYTRLRTLAQDLGETPRELWLFHYMRGGMETARALATQLMALAQERREATLHRIQQLVHDKAMFAPIYQIAAMTGVGPRVEESGIGLVAGYAFFSAPYEDVKLKGR